MVKTKLEFGDILQIGNEKAIYCGMVKSSVEGHHRLLIYSRSKYQVQYVQDTFFERLKQRGCVVNVIGNNKRIAEKCKKQEEAKQKFVFSRF